MHLPRLLPVGVLAAREVSIKMAQTRPFVPGARPVATRTSSTPPRVRCVAQGITVVQDPASAHLVRPESSRRALGKAAAISAGKGSTKITKAKKIVKIVKVVLRAVAQRVKVGARGTAKRAVLPDNMGIITLHRM